MQASSGVESWGHSLAAVWSFSLQCCFSYCALSTQALQLWHRGVGAHSMWSLSQNQDQTQSSAVAGFTTGPPGNLVNILIEYFQYQYNQYSWSLLSKNTINYFSFTAFFYGLQHIIFWTWTMLSRLIFIAKTKEDEFK